MESEKLDEEGLTAAEREIVEAKRAKHKRVQWTKFEDYGLVILRPPTQKEFGRFKNAVTDERQANDLAELNYVRDAICYPEEALRVQTILEDYPVWVGEAAVSVNALGGAGVAQLTKSTGKGSA
jgi:hypothetical protein